MFKTAVTSALILGAFATLIILGTWQMQRLAWKENLIAQAQERPMLPAPPLHMLVEEFGLSGVLGTGYTDDDQSSIVDALVYRRVIVTGEFVGEPVRVFTTLSDPNGPFEGPGYWLMQAFEAGGPPFLLVFVNRGFIPFELEPGQMVRDEPTGHISFEGLIRPDDVPTLFTPEPDFSQQLIYRRSVSQMMQATGVSMALPITIDMPVSAAGGLPQAGETKFAFTNRHFGYMLTWYGLALVLAGVVGAAWWRHR